MEKPLISFVIAFYNLPTKMLCGCIDSILALSLTTDEREIIVVDDGSEVSPVNELMKYGDEITYIRQRNQGLSEARNTGVQMATGQYLQFVDADDSLLKDAYDWCLQIARNKSPEMVVFDFTKSTPTSKDFQEQPTQSGCHYMRHNNLHGTACGYMFARSILGDLRFTSGIYHEDEEFTPMLILRAESVVVTTAQAYCYKERQDSITNDEHHIEKRLNDLKAIILRLHTAADRLPIDEKTALQRRVAQLTMDYIYQIILQIRSSQKLENEIDELTQQGLFPLPEQDYTTKYTWFRRLSSKKTGRSLLLRIIPLMSKER